MLFATTAVFSDGSRLTRWIDAADWLDAMDALCRAVDPSVRRLSARPVSQAPTPAVIHLAPRTAAGPQHQEA